jgi:hypothetical protein
VVYVIRNDANERVYVGATTYRPERRLYQFRSVARHPGKWPRIETLLPQAMRRIGPERFFVEVLERCETPEQLDAAERAWIVRLGSLVPRGYNTQGGGLSGRDPGIGPVLSAAALNRGRKHSPEWNAKISAAMRGNQNFRAKQPA